MCCLVGTGCRVSFVYLLLRTFDADAIRRLTEVVVRACCHQRMMRFGRCGPRAREGNPSQKENIFYKMQMVKW